MENDRIVKMLKLYNGDYIIGEYDNCNKEANTTTLYNPRAFVFMPTASGTMKVGFQPVCFFDKKSRDMMTFNNEQIMLVVENEDIPKEIESGYKSDISGISMANAADIAAVNSTKTDSSGPLII